MSESEYEEFGRLAERNFEGISTGPGASLERAIHQAARAAAENGHAGQPFIVGPIVIEPQGHNQWVKAYRVTITPTG